MLESHVVGKYLSQQQISSRPYWPLSPTDSYSYYLESHIHHPLKPAPGFTEFTSCVVDFMYAHIKSSCTCLIRLLLPCSSELDEVQEAEEPGRAPVLGLGSTWERGSKVRVGVLGTSLRLWWCSSSLLPLCGVQSSRFSSYIWCTQLELCINCVWLFLQGVCMLHTGWSHIHTQI